MSNVSIRAGGSPIPAGDLVAVDGTTITGDGSARNPLIASGGADLPSAFTILNANSDLGRPRLSRARARRRAASRRRATTRRNARG